MSQRAVVMIYVTWLTHRQTACEPLCTVGIQRQLWSTKTSRL